MITATCDGCGNTATKVITVTENPPICPAEPGSSEGNPINPAAAYKMQTEVDFTDAAPHGLSLSRHYRSSAGVAPANLGSAWSHNYAGRISITGDVVANISLGSGGGASFLRDTNTSPWSPDLVGASNFDRLVQSDETLIYTRASDESQWVFTNASPGVLPVVAARLISIKERNGRIMTLTYNAAGQISQVTNAFGRSLSFSYNANNQLNQVTTPDGKFIGYVFGSNGAVQSVSYPDNASKQYLYELPTFPQALTGITNEAGQRYATFSYDAQGRAVGTAHAGGVESYAITYPADAASAIPAQGSLVADGQPINPAIFRTSAQVTDPLGNVRTVRYQGGDGSVRVLGQTSPAGGSQFASRDFGLGGTLPTQEIDFLGFITQTTWDTARRLPTQVVRAATRPEAQTVQTQWHPTLRLPTLVTEVGRTMATTYDALGNKLSETITDTSTPANTARTSAWTYNAQGLVATETAPNGGITSYTYNTAGNPLVVTNPLGHATTFAYAGADGAAGRVTSMLAPTGLLTSYIYDLRGRLLTSVQSAGASTLASLYTYTLSGQLASASLPSGHEISYSYDAAQRLTGWQDNRGARGVYTLDAMGNRTTEQIQNTAGQVVWQLARSINALNRVASETVGNAAGTVNSNLQTSYSYNANGSLTSEANGLSQATTYGLDALRRVSQITNAANATANLSYNALDAVTSASDFKGVATTTPRDALGNAVATSSPDAGAQTAEYDALGLPKRIVDALGQATSITRDALGRPTSIVHADGRNTTLRYDLTGATYNAAGFANASKGYVSEIADTTDNTKYLRDGFGRVLRKTQQLAPFTSGSAKSISYSYAASPTGQDAGTGQMDSITYPNGTKVSYVYSTAGQISQMNWGNANNTGKPLVSDIQYTPLGQPASWVWQFADTKANSALTATRAYDTAGRVIATELGTYTYDAAGRIIRLTQELAKPANTTVGNKDITSTVAVYTIGYDSLGRISSFSRAAGMGAVTTAPLTAQSATFSYDANGNRLTSVQTSSSGTAQQSTSRSYTVASTSNRLQSFSQSQTSGTATTGAITAVNYQYDANGALLADGLRRYEYDAANRLANVTTGVGIDAPTTRYVHNALGQRLFKTEPQYAPVNSASNPADPGVMQTLLSFFSNLWGSSTSTATPTTSLTPSAADQLGFAYYYDEDGSLLYEQGTGGAQSTGSAHYVYLPTPAGPMPVAFYNGSRHYAVHTDHLNTPRRLTQSDKKIAWQWAFSAFGDELPTTASNRFVDIANTPSLGTTKVDEVSFNLRYPGQYFDKESGLSYNYFRSYDARTGRYSQSDPIGLDGGWNRFTYAESNPLSFTDPEGLLSIGGGVGGSVGGTSRGGQGGLSCNVGDDCYKGYEENIKICNKLKSPRGRALCYAGAAITLGACLAGKL